jgi:RimJ/RimL family protein N-acetyltransferase
MFIRTKRLLLRPHWPEDTHALAVALNDQDVAQQLSAVPHPYRLADAAYFIEQHMAHDVPQPQFALIALDEPDQPLIGGIGLAGAPNASAQLGFWIAQTFWRRGFATEAARAVLELAFLGLKHEQIIAQRHVENAASAALLEGTLGFTGSDTGTLWCDARGHMVAVQKHILGRAAWEAQHWPKLKRAA